MEVRIGDEFTHRTKDDIARVCGVIRDSIPSARMLKLDAQESAKTGRAPARATQPAVAKNVKEGQITSSPDPIPSAINATKIASVPDDIPMPNRAPTIAAAACSKRSTSGPLMYRPECKTRRNAAVNSSSSGRFCRRTSSNGTFMENT